MAPECSHLLYTEQGRPLLPQAHWLNHFLKALGGPSLATPHDVTCTNKKASIQIPLSLLPALL